MPTKRFCQGNANLSPRGSPLGRGQESMAASLGVSPRQLRRLLDELKTANYLEIEVRKGRGPHQDLSRNRSRRSGRGAAKPAIRDRPNL